MALTATRLRQEAYLTAANCAVSQIYYLILHCDDQTLAARLHERPAWHNQTEAFIAEQRRFNQWLVEHAATAFEPLAALVDMTELSALAVAEVIRGWAARQWRRERKLHGPVEP